MRADVFLCRNGYCESRSRAQACIKGGLLYVNGKRIDKCSEEIGQDDKAELKGQIHPYVGRGGVKLEHALKEFGIDPSGLTCVDIGASTGGFTDVLLRNGAKKVIAVDCGRGQLHQSLLCDARVINMEGFNARELSHDVLGERCELAVMDVSFISQTLLHGAVSDIIKDGAHFITLIKPQFEAGRSGIGKNGIVKDKSVQRDAVIKVTESAAEHGLALCGITLSPIAGGDGNTEFLACFKLGGEKKTERAALELRINELLKTVTGKKR